MSFKGVTLFSKNFSLWGFKENENINYILIKHTEVSNPVESILDKSLHAPFIRPVLTSVAVPTSCPFTFIAVLPKLGNDGVDVDNEVDVVVDIVVDLNVEDGDDEYVVSQLEFNVCKLLPLN
jgi:hypothetical protein